VSVDREQTIGLTAALGAFGIWGLAPVYFKFLSAVDATEIIAHRIIWSLVFLAIVLLLRHRTSVFERIRIGPRLLGALTVSGLLIVANWLIFVYAVNTDRILSTSLGYFINPLVSVLFGLLLFGERLRPIQVIAVIVATIGTAYMTIKIGEFPWLALGLAGTFAMYSVVRKVADVGPMVGLFWETLITFPLACGWLIWLARQEQLAFAPAAWVEALLLAGTGLVTLVPLLLFAAGVRRLPLSTIGILQYLAPCTTFLLGVFVYREPFTMDHAVTFGCIWMAVVLFTGSSIAQLRRARVAI